MLWWHGSSWMVKEEISCLQWEYDFNNGNEVKETTAAHITQTQMSKLFTPFACLFSRVGSVAKMEKLKPQGKNGATISNL